MEVVNIKDFKREGRKRAIKDKVQKCKEWIVRNKEAAVASVPIVIGGITTVVKAVNKHNSQRKEQELKELYCYDRSLGHYWKLKRPLSNDEWLEIDKRKKSGERLPEILEELRVLD